MKRKILVLLLIGIFDFVLIKGISYANMLMFQNDFLIQLLPEEEKLPIDEEENPTEDQTAGEYDGENASVIGKKINKFLVKTLLEGYGENIASIAIKKGVNPYLVGGIILENTNCQVDCSVILRKCNNVGEIKGTPGCFGGSYKKYDSLDDSIADLVDYLYDEFIVNDLKTPNAIYKKYGYDTTWAFKVNEYMKEIKKS